MRILVFALLCLVSAAPAQKPTDTQRNDFQATLTEFRKQGKDALEQEQLRAKQPLCAKAENNVGSQFCLKAEFQKTDAHRLLYVRAVGGLLRTTSDTLQCSGKPRRLAFDDGETGWITYRDRTCQAIYESYEGGSGAAGASWDCQITVTRNHMLDLSQIYSELWG